MKLCVDAFLVKGITIRKTSSCFFKHKDTKTLSHKDEEKLNSLSKLQTSRFLYWLLFSLWLCVFVFKKAWTWL